MCGVGKDMHVPQISVHFHFLHFLFFLFRLFYTIVVSFA
jgi:hypothetical protein